MKKIFSKLENKNEENFVPSFTGKVFTINKHSVVVEEILAEGESAEQIAISSVLQFRDS